VRVRDADRTTTTDLATLDARRHPSIASGRSQLPTDLTSDDALRTTCLLDFVDAAGECWRRDAGGRLTRLAQIAVDGQVLATGTRHDE
jgi:hypothetical protein